MNLDEILAGGQKTGINSSFLTTSRLLILR